METDIPLYFAVLKGKGNNKADSFEIKCCYSLETYYNYYKEYNDLEDKYWTKIQIISLDEMINTYKN